MGVKMKGIKLCVLAVFVLSLFQFNLYSLITSRVEGTVIDEDTNLPVKKARVALYSCNRILKDHCSKTYFDIETDSKGHFCFDNIIKGYYFLCVYKEGYATFGPVREYEEKIEHGPLSVGFTIKSTKVDKFYLKEGRIKHFKIMLEKEAVVEVSVTKKTNKGTENVNPNNFIVELKWVDSNRKLSAPAYVSNTIKRFGRLSGGDLIEIIFTNRGYPKKRYNRRLLKGETISINHLIDFTIGQVIHGFVRKKNTGKSIKDALIIIGKEYSHRDNLICIYPDKNGEYLIGGLEPGRNFLYIRSAYYGIKYKTHIEIRPNEIRELNFEF